MAKGRKKGTSGENGKGKALGLCVDAYVARLEAIGKSVPTIRSYQGDLRQLVRHLGEDRVVAKILVPHVARHLKSSAFTTKADGTPKAELSVTKSRRAVRQFFEWMVEMGEIDRVPFPAN